VEIIAVSNLQGGIVASLTRPHWEALTPVTREAFHLLGRLDFINRFYLAGGTGLSFHLGHRFSVDLDFFSADADSVVSDQRSALRSLLDDPTLEITYDKDSTFVGTWHGVGVSFFRLNLYPVVKPTLLLDGISLARVEEIGAMKLAAIIDRGTRKDYVDLYYILQCVSLDSLFRVAAIKYAKVRSFPVSATRALCYFDDAESLPMPQMIDKTPWTKTKKFLDAKAVEAGRQRLADLWE
jgi:hypothetical protein